MGLLEEYGIKQSMSREENCYDNAVMENFFGHLQSELIYLEEFENVKEFKVALAEYIEYYNNCYITFLFSHFIKLCQFNKGIMADILEIIPL